MSENNISQKLDSLATSTLDDNFRKLSNELNQQKISATIYMEFNHDKIKGALPADLMRYLNSSGTGLSVLLENQYLNKLVIGTSHGNLQTILIDLNKHKIEVLDPKEL